MALTPSLINKNYQQLSPLFSTGPNSGVSGGIDLTVPVGGNYGFDPRSIPGCILCLDAAYPSNVGSDSWKDLSVASDITCTGPIMYGPTGPYKYSKAIYFNSDCLVSNIGPNSIDITTSDFAIFAVVFIPTTSGYIIYKGNSTINWGLYYNGTNAVFSYKVSGVVRSASRAISSGWNLISGVALRGTSTSVGVNGTSTTTTSFSATTLTSNLPLYIGSTGPNMGYNGNMAEILVYNSTITTVQRQQIEGYLAWKWQLQANLPATHSYSITKSPSTKPFLRDFQPPDLTGINHALWFDAADPSTILFGSGDNVAVWVSKTSYTNPATNYIAVPYVSLKPTYVATEKGVRFTDNSTYTGSPLKTTRNSFAPCESVFVVFTATSFDSTRTTGGSNSNGYSTVFVSSTTGNSGGAFGPGFGVTGSATAPTKMQVQTPYGADVGAGYSATTTAFSTNKRYMVSYNILRTGTTGSYGYDVSMFNNGTALTSGSTGDLNSVGSTTNTIMLGGNFSNWGAFQGLLHEVIIYESNSISITDSQREQVEGYLAWKWNITNPTTLPSTHSFKQFPSATVVPR